MKWFDETHVAEMDGLAGEGRTTETIKGNADDLVAHKADKAKYAEFRKVQNQSIPNGSHTQIIWDQKDSFFDEDFTELENGRIKILEKGIYEIHIRVGFAINATGYRYVTITINSLYVPAVSTPGPLYVSVSGFAAFDVNDLLDIKVGQTSGNALDINSGTNTIVRIRQVVKID